MKIINSVMSFMLQMFLYASAATAKYSVYIIDSIDEHPIEDAYVYGGFVMESRGWDNTPPANLDKKRTNEKGVCQLSGKTDAGRSYFGVEKDGYYNLRYTGIKFSDHSFWKLGRWLPDNLIITARLDRVIHPIPLFVVQPHLRQWKKVFGNRRSIDQASTSNTVSASYDLMLGQWLPPFGNGEYADLMVEAKTEPLGIDEYNLPDHKTTRYKTTQKITFTGEGNGIIEMPFDPMAKLHIRIAPTNGYNCTSIIRWKAWQGVKEQYKTSYNENRCFAFRIRTQKDAKGNIVKTYYGKIYGDVNFMEYNAPMGTYYLNTNPNDPNLEYDMKNNLNRNDELEFCILNP